MSTTHPPDPIGTTATETPVAVPAAGRSDDGESEPLATLPRTRGPRPPGRPADASIAVFVGIWWLVTALHIWKDVFVPSPARGVAPVHRVGHHPRRTAGPERLLPLGAPAGRACGGSLHRASAARSSIGVPLGLLLATRATVPARRRAVRRLHARPAAAGLLQPADHLVRHRGHLEDLAALPRRPSPPIALAVVAGVSGIRARAHRRRPVARRRPAARSLRYMVAAVGAARAVHRHPPRHRLRLDDDRRRRDRRTASPASAAWPGSTKKEFRRPTSRCSA